MLADNKKQIDILKKALNIWQEKRGFYEYELAISGSSSSQFELKKRIEICREEIERLVQDINFLSQAIPEEDKVKAEINQEDSKTVSIDNAIRQILDRKRSNEETRDAVITSLRYIIEQPDLKQDTIKFVLDTAIKNIDNNDGRTKLPSTEMDKAFEKVLRSSPNCVKLCKDRLLQGYINADGEHRQAIAGILLFKLATDIEDLNTENTEQILIRPLRDFKDKDNQLSIEQRVEAGLQLVETFFRLHSYKFDTKLKFLPTLIPGIIEVLISVLEAPIITVGDNAVSHAAIWILVWVTRAKYCHSYKSFEFTSSQLSILRKIVEDNRQDPFARSYAALVLSVCIPKNHLFTQANWVYQWAEIADGGNSTLPNLKTFNRLGNSNDPNIKAIISLITTHDLPIRVQKSAAISLGRLEYFNSEMVEPLLSAFKNPMLPSEERDEALVYLTIIGNSQVISAFKEGIQSKDSTDNYDLKRRCFLALNSLGDRSAQEQKSFFTNNKNKYLAQQGHLIHKLKAKDSTGRWAYYFVYVESRKEQAFLDALDSNENIDLEDYGKVIGSSYGEKPNDQLRALLKNTYGFDV